MLALIDDARAEGLDVTFDAYPSEWANTRLVIQLPQWVQAGGPGALKERIAERATRDRIRAGFDARGASYASAAGWADVRLGAFHRPENLRWESRSVADVMAETGHDALDVICDLLLAEDLGLSQVTSGPATRDDGSVPGASRRDGRHRQHLPRRQAEPADVRQLPADPRPVRARRGAASASRRRSAR